MKDRTDRGYANQLNDLPYLLPMPMASPSGNTPEEHLRKKPGREVVTDLAIIAENDLFESGGRLLPTPRTTDSGGPGIHGNGGQDLRTEISLLPTPDAYAGTRGGTQAPEKRRAGGHAVSVADVVEHELLPTPAVADVEGGRKRRSGARSNELLLNGIAEEIFGPEAEKHELLPTPKASDGPNGGPNMRGSSGDLSMPSVVHQADFGKYAGAIARWAKVLGRPAPEPTEPGTKPGKRRLSALFVEWMMGQPEGRVTDPELGLSRTQQIKALGNGVVTQQAEIALGRLMERMPR